MGKRILKFASYALERENYPLLWRTIVTAWRLRRLLGDRSPKMQLLPAIRAAESFGAVAQAGWRISRPEKVLLFTAAVSKLPLFKGLCAQQSLISWHLLKSYGIPARICYGLSRHHPDTSGHAWVELLLADEWQSIPPFDSSAFLLVYASDNPSTKGV